MIELTRQQLSRCVRDSVRKVVKADYSKGLTPSVSRCMDAVRHSLKTKLRSLNPQSGSMDHFNRWIEAACSDIEPLVRESINTTLTGLKSRHISSISAKAIVEDILVEKGFADYGFIMQTHRMKVRAGLPSGRYFRFCIRFKHMQDDLSHVREGLDAALLLSGLFDKDTSII